MAVEKIPKNVTLFVMPGNDDEFEVDEVLKRYEKEYDNVIFPIGKAVEIPGLPGYEMISMEWVNPTPWNTPRECSERELGKKLKNLEKQVSVDWDHVICNFHCPPYNTKLDIAPKLDKNLRPVYVLGELVRVHVGSKAIRKFHEKHQPLLGLHGHIHESFASDKIGKTIVLNPGSEYTEGILRGFVIDIDPKEGLQRYWKVEG